MRPRSEDQILTLFSPSEMSSLKTEIGDAIAKKKAHNLKVHRWIKLGILVSKFGIDQLDEICLRGAFAEIQEKALLPDRKQQWQQSGKELLQKELEAKCS